MSRYFTLRSLGLLVIALLLMAVMVGLGLWQFGAYDEHQADDARVTLKSAPIPIDEALSADEGFPSSSVGRPVTAVGSYQAGQQFYVTGFDGAHGTYAVVTPLVTANGSAVLVVRGSSDDTAAAPPSGEVTVTGVLQPSQSDGEPLDSQRITNGIRISGLVSAIDQDLYAGYVVLTSSDPSDGLAAVTPPLAEPSRWAGIRNLLYALQWWIFAGFVAFMWWRVVQDADETSHQTVG